ncbi:hypothetical protein B7767_44090 [Streptomyces sp. 13-12-16]|nr:hypothetical protein B7767_44090 [Streptomyces sp. 13-12-16]
MPTGMRWHILSRASFFCAHVALRGLDTGRSAWTETRCRGWSDERRDDVRGPRLRAAGGTGRRCGRRESESGSTTRCPHSPRRAISGITRNDPLPVAQDNEPRGLPLPVRGNHPGQL